MTTSTRTARGLVRRAHREPIGIPANLRLPLAFLIALAFVLAAFVPQVHATIQPTRTTYVTAVWWALGTNQWPAEGQTIAANLVHESKALDLDFVKAEAAKLGCGYTIQGDLYADDKTTKKLLEGGKLYGPSNPKESWPGGEYRSEYSTVFYTGDCAPDTIVPMPDYFVHPATCERAGYIEFGTNDNYTWGTYDPTTGLNTATTKGPKTLFANGSQSFTMPPTFVEPQLDPTKAPCFTPPPPTPITVAASAFGWSCSDGIYTGNEIIADAPHATYTVTKDGEPFTGPLTDLGAGKYVLTFSADEAFTIVGESVFTFDVTQPTEGCLDPCDLEESNCTPEPPTACDPTQQACAEVPPTVPANLATTGTDAENAIALIVALVMGGGAITWWAQRRRRITA